MPVIAMVGGMFSGILPVLPILVNMISKEPLEGKLFKTGTNQG